MASHLSIRTVRTVAVHVRHALFPSRLAALVALSIEIGALPAGLSIAGHIGVAVVVHLAIALVEICRRH